MNLISLDIEATDSGEMLELSIIRFNDKEEIYHSYFKPLHTYTWTNKAHHITPEMVRHAPAYDSERDKIQKILDKADGIIGFALHNDLRYLENHKFEIPSNTLLLEVQDWFWYYIGRAHEFPFGMVPKLSKCAEMLDYRFSEDADAHSATNDTMMTIKIFEDILYRHCNGKINEQIINGFNKVFTIEKEKFAEQIAHGVLSLIPVANGFILKNNSTETGIANDLSIVVDSRYMAEHDIREKFRKRETPPNSGVYKLRKSEIDFFLNYTNEYDASKEDFYKHFYKAQRLRRKR